MDHVRSAFENILLNKIWDFKHFFVYVSTQPISCQWSKPVFWYYQGNVDVKLVKKAALDIMMFYRLTRGLKTLLYVFTKKVWIVDEKNAAKSWKLTHGLM